MPLSLNLFFNPEGHVSSTTFRINQWTDTLGHTLIR